MLENVPEGLTFNGYFLHLTADLSGCRYNKGIYFQFLTSNESSGRLKITEFASGARADIGSVNFCALHFPHGGLVVGRVRFGYHRNQVLSVVHSNAVVSTIRIVVFWLIGGHGALGNIVERGLIRFNNPVFTTGFNYHVRQGHSSLHIHGHHPIAGKLHGSIVGTIHADIPDDLQDQIFGLHIGGDFTLKNKLHGFRYFDPQLTRA